MSDHTTKHWFRNNQKFCVIYRPHSQKNPLVFCKSSKTYSRFYSEWEMTLFCAMTSTLTQLKNQTTNCFIRNYFLHLNWNGKTFEGKNRQKEPTRVTTTPATCLDHIVTSYQINTETIKRTISDHYTVLGAIPGVIVNESKNREINQLSRDLRKIQGGNALNVLFLLDQTLKKLEPSKQKDLEKIADTIILCIDKLAPGKASTMEKISNDWINNKLKNEITKKQFVSKLDKMVFTKAIGTWWQHLKNAKPQSNHAKLGETSIARLIYRILKSCRRHDPPAVNLTELLKINQVFTAIGPKLTSSILLLNTSMKLTNFRSQLSWTTRMNWKFLS